MEDNKVVERAYGFSMEVASRGMKIFEKDAILLWREYKQGDESALEKLIKGYHKMVQSVVHVRFWRLTECCKDDCMQVGYIAICKAVDSYDESKGSTLSSWVYSRITWDVIRFVQTNTVVHIPLEEVSSYYKHELDFDDTEGLYANRFINILDIDEVEDTEYSDEYTYCMEEGVIDNLVNSGLFKEIRNILTDRQWNCLVKYYVGNLSLREIADVYGLCEGRIRQIISKAIIRLRMNKKFCNCFFGVDRVGVKVGGF